MTKEPDNLNSGLVKTKCTLPDVPARKKIEEHLSLADLHSLELPQTRSEAFSLSIKNILLTGALPEESVRVKSDLAKTKAKRMEAYLSMSSTGVAATKGLRIRIAYRLVTYMARAIDGMSCDTLLSDMLNNEYREDPSIYPFQVNVPSIIPGMHRVVKTAEAIQYLEEYKYTFSDTQEAPYNAGMTYLPPALPDFVFGEGLVRRAPRMRRMGYVPEDYNPEEDKALSLWLDAYEILAGELRIEDGTVLEPASGIQGMAGLFCNNSARFMWPCKDDLLLYELELMLFLFDKLCDESIRRVEEWVRYNLGYTRAEAVVLVKTALKYGSTVYSGDIEFSKSREMRMLESMFDKSNDGEDPRAAIAARKQIEFVAGMTKRDDGGTEEFRDLASKALENNDDLLLE